MRTLCIFAGTLLLAACASTKPLPEPQVAQKVEEPAPPPKAEAPPPAPAPAKEIVKEEPKVTPVPTEEPRAAVYYAFDSSYLDERARATLDEVASEVLKGQQRLRIEGNCDERGTSEYNLALGQRRADAAKNYLARLGVDASRIDAISWGKERPKMPGHDEESWRINRRSDLFVKEAQLIGLK